MAITVYPRGGLGNQLFALAAAYVISNESESFVLVDGSLTQFGSNLSRHFDLAKIQLSGIENFKIVETDFSHAFQTLEWIRRKLRFPYSMYRHPEIECECQNPTLLQLLDFAKLFSSFTGQFQDMSIVNAAATLGFPTELKPTKPSRYFIAIQADLRNSFHGIHIRGGDYRKQRDTYSEIPLEYYLNAIELYPDIPIVVFTDDLNYAQSKYFMILDRAQRVISSLDRLDAVETMALLAKSTVLTTANSTFSTWAGWFAGHRNAQINTVTPHHLDGWVDSLPLNWNRYKLPGG